MSDDIWTPMDTGGFGGEVFIQDDPPDEHDMGDVWYPTRSEFEPNEFEYDIRESYSNIQGRPYMYDGDVILLDSSSEELVRLDAEDYSIVYEEATDILDYDKFELIGGYAAIASGSELELRDPSDGSFLWKTDHGDDDLWPEEFALDDVEDRLYMSARDSETARIYAYELSNGENIWSYNFGGSSGMNVSGVGVATFDGRIFGAEDQLNRVIVEVDSDGSEIRRSDGGWVNDVNRMVYFESSDSIILLTDGGIRSVDYESDDFDYITVIGDTPRGFLLDEENEVLYAMWGEDDDTMSKVNALDWTTIWEIEFPDGEGSFANGDRMELSPERLFMSYRDFDAGNEFLIALDVENGRRIWKGDVDNAPFIAYDDKNTRVHASAGDWLYNYNVSEAPNEAIENRFSEKRPLLSDGLIFAEIEE